MEDLPHYDRLVILSDIHLGRGDPETGFADSSEALAAALTHVKTLASMVVINGDLYDLDRGVVPIAQGVEYRAIAPRWRQVEHAMCAGAMRMTTGNHDHALLGKNIGGHEARASIQCFVGPMRVHIEHGERFNAWVKQWRAFTSLVTWLSGRFSKPPWRIFYDFLRRIEQKTTDDSEGGVVKRAADWLQTEAAIDVFVMGHTHQELAVQIGHQWLLNPGDSMRIPLRFILLDASESCAFYGTVDDRGEIRMNQQLALFPLMGNASSDHAPAF